MLCSRFVPHAMKLTHSDRPDLYFWRHPERVAPHFLDKAWHMLLQVVC